MQAKFLKGYPHPMEFMCMQTVMSMVQSFVVAIVMERDPLEWKLGWNIRLFAVLYCVSSLITKYTLSFFLTLLSFQLWDFVTLILQSNLV